MEAAATELDGLDVLIFNGPGPAPGTALDTPAEAYPAALERSLLSVVHMCLAAVPHMRVGHWGRIVAITSLGVRQPYPHLVCRIRPAPAPWRSSAPWPASGRPRHHRQLRAARTGHDGPRRTGRLRRGRQRGTRDGPSSDPHWSPRRGRRVRSGRCPSVLALGRLPHRHGHSGRRVAYRALQ